MKKYCQNQLISKVTMPRMKPLQVKALFTLTWKDLGEQARATPIVTKLAIGRTEEVNFALSILASSVMRVSRCALTKFALKYSMALIRLENKAS